MYPQPKFKIGDKVYWIGQPDLALHQFTIGEIVLSATDVSYSEGTGRYFGLNSVPEALVFLHKKEARKHRQSLIEIAMVQYRQALWEKAERAERSEKNDPKL